MVDLSQDQQLKQTPTLDVPTTDQPPVEEAPEEEKAVTPKEEEIKKELSELGIPPEGGSKKTKVLLATLGVILLIATLPAAVYLVKQRQEIRKEAIGETCWHSAGFTFPDVPPGSTYFEAVDCLTGLPYCCIAGYPGSIFKPNQIITRAEAVTFITRYHIHVRKDWQWYDPIKPSFSDVPRSHWAFLFVETAKNEGFIVGLPGGIFRPDESWRYGFHGIDRSEYDFTQEGPTITRGNFIQGLYDYGMDRKELPECAPPAPLTCTDLVGAPDPSSLAPGDEIALTCTGSSDSIPIGYFKFRISIDSGTPVELPLVPATKTDGEYKGVTTYEIPDYGCYQIECQACTADGCTTWGQAQ